MKADVFYSHTCAPVGRREWLSVGTLSIWKYSEDSKIHKSSELGLSFPDVELLSGSVAFSQAVRVLLLVSDPHP